MHEKAAEDYFIAWLDFNRINVFKVRISEFKTHISLTEACPCRLDQTLVQMPEALSSSHENLHQTRLILLILLDVFKNLRLSSSPLRIAINVLMTRQ